MSSTETEAKPEGLLQQIDRRIAALAAAEKQLKKPSTISFAERQSLASKAAKAGAELKARRPEAEAHEAEAAPAAEETGAEAGGEATEAGGEATEATEAAAPALPAGVKAALAEADRILGLIGGAQMGGGKGRAGVAAKVVGQARRSGGMNAQQRPPDRVGGE